MTAVLVAAALVGGCASTHYLDLPNAGRTLAYESGAPNFDLEAVVTWREGQPGVDIYLGIPRTSLVYVRLDSVYVGAYEAFIRTKSADGETLLNERRIEDTLRTRSYEATQTYVSVVDTLRLAPPPGQYVIEAVLEDRQSRRQAVRRTRVMIPTPGEPLHLSGIRFLRQEGNEQSRRALALHLQTGFDTLRAVTEFRAVFQKERAQPVGVQMRLLRFTSDTSAAAAPHAFTPFRGSIEYMGIDYEEADTLQSTLRQIDVQGDVVLEFIMPALAPGVYRVEVIAREPEGERLLSRERTFSVKSPSFPRVMQLGEMIRALDYIATDEEMERMLAAEEAAEMRRRFDAFWGALIPQRQRAANLLEKYFERVQEANLRFTTHKAGWKTDRGMVYLLLGAPLEVRRHPQRIVWSYSYNDRDALNTFVFERVDLEDDVFEHAVLQRRPYYEMAWRRVIERWREGEVL